MSQNKISSQTIIDMLDMIKDMRNRQIKMENALCALLLDSYHPDSQTQITNTVSVLLDDLSSTLSVDNDSDESLDIENDEP